MNIKLIWANLFAIGVFVLAAATATVSARQNSSKAAGSPAPAQDGSSRSAQDGSMPDMPGMDMGEMQKDATQNPDAAKDATKNMSDRDMDMGAHMFMTDLRPAQPGDEQRAQEIVDALRPAIAKYKDYHVALADGFKIFLPNFPQPQYHFTSYRNAFAAQFKFDPERPTSLLYKKTASGYDLVGAMYTAPRRASYDQLNERVPLSVARWHKHVNFCLPPRGTPAAQIDWKKFGAGSIATEGACEEANGRWLPQVFGWMVHVYPLEADPNNVWAH